MVRPSTSNGQIPVRQEIGPWKGAPRSSLPRAACRTPSPGRGGGLALPGGAAAVDAACEAGAPPPDADGGDLRSRLEVADAIPTGPLTRTLQLAQPLRPVVEIPSTRRRWKAMKKPMMGKRESSDIARV